MGRKGGLRSGIFAKMLLFFLVGPRAQYFVRGSNLECAWLVWISRRVRIKRNSGCMVEDEGFLFYLLGSFYYFFVIHSASFLHIIFFSFY